MGWQVTATTLHCDSVEDFATIMVYPDNTAKCAFFNKHSKTSRGQKRLKTCKWPNCAMVEEFRERAFKI